MFGRKKGTSKKGSTGSGRRKTQKPAVKKKNRPSAGSKATGSKKKTSVKKPSNKSSAAGKRSAATRATTKAGSKNTPQRRDTTAKKSKSSSRATSKRTTGSSKATAGGKKTTVKRSAARKPATKKKPVNKAAKKPTVKKTGGTTSRLKVSAGKRTSTKPKPVKKKESPRRKAVSGHASPIKPPFEAYKGIRPYLFTSYAHHDMKTVFNIIKKLYKKRYRIWYDEGIEPGNEWPEIVGKAIVNCTQFIVFMSPHAAVSRNVRNEINLAFTEDKNILVVFLKKTKLTEGMKLQIGTVQFVNRFELSEREFLEKIDKVLDSNMKN